MLSQKSLKRKILLFLSFLGLFFALTTAHLKAKSTKPSQETILPVSVQRAEEVASYQQTASFAGEITPRRSSELSFERSGKLLEILVPEGIFVEQNTPLAKLDTSHLLLKKKELFAGIKAHEARLEEMQEGPRKETIASAKASLMDLEEQASFLVKKELRRKKLFQEKTISQEELDEIASQKKALQARILAMKKNIEELEKGTRKEQIDGQKALLDQAKAQMEEVLLEEERSTLRAPYSGKIALHHLHAGTIVAPGQPVLRLVEMAWEVKIGIPLDRVSSMKEGHSYPLLTEGKIHPAKLISLLPELEGNTKTVTLLFSVPSSNLFFAGQISYLQLEENIPTRAFWIPITALVKGPRGTWSCFVVVPGEIQGEAVVVRREVTLFRTESHRVLVQGPLSSGEKIISSGTHRVVAGQKVKPMDDKRLVKGY